MPRVFEYIFNQIKLKEQNDTSHIYQVKASFLEIYQEKVYDLLINQRKSLLIREDNKLGVFVDNLSCETITSKEEALQVMKKGMINRKVGETSMNKKSSRSHSVFTLTIRIINKKNQHEKFSRFNLIDLAGSERQKSTNTTGLALKEATQINKSLSALGNVIMALSDQSKYPHKSRHIHYRDSKLTFLLKDSLGGNSLTYLIACISPAKHSYGETISTLNFAQRAKHIKNTVYVNEIHQQQPQNQQQIQQLHQEIQTLKQQIDQYKQSAAKDSQNAKDQPNEQAKIGL